MPRRAKHCDECQHFEPYRDGVCLLEHRPRFYMPNEITVMNQQWGYKRVCADYVPALEYRPAVTGEETAA